MTRLSSHDIGIITVMLYLLQHWLSDTVVIERVVVHNTRIFPLKCLQEEKCCLLYNNLDGNRYL